MVASSCDSPRPDGVRRRRRRTSPELALARLVDRLAAHHPPTYDHCRRVASLSRQLAIKLGLGHEAVHAAFAAGLLHDIGHLYTPVAILNKQGPLGESDLAIIREHPGAGYVLIRELALEPAVGRCALEHHERPDGRGYPRALGGIEPITAIVATASVFDSITHVRWENRVQPQSYALAEARRVAGTQLDPRAVSALGALLDAA